jgi:hypothetical protein
METKLKMFVSEVLVLALIGFIVFLLVIASGFVSCCLNISQEAYDYILMGLAAAGLIAFGICSYRNCFKKVMNS